MVDLPAGFRVVQQQPALPAGFRVAEQAAPAQEDRPFWATPNTIGGAIHDYGKPVGDALGAFQSGVNQGMTLNFMDEIVSGVSAPFNAIGPALEGEGYDIGRAFNESQDTLAARRAEVEGRNPVAATVGNVAGGVGAGAGLARGGLSFLSAAKPAVTSMAPRAAADAATFGAVAGFGAGDGLEDRVRNATTSVLWGGPAGLLLGAGGGAIASRAANKAIPAAEDLATQARALYGEAERLGTTAPIGDTIKLADTAFDIARAEGLVSPTGRMSSAYPRITEALRTLDDYSHGPMNVPQMQAVRKTLSDAAKSTEAAERRVAVMLLDELDDMTSPLAPQLAQARQLYHRAKNGELIDTAIELAGARAQQFSGSGFENALRTEFRAIERSIIKGELRGFSQAEFEAIKRVNHGGTLANVLRGIGKLTASGPVSGAASFGGPALATTLFTGNPVLGAAVGAGTLAAGGMSRSLATAATRAAADRASAVARAGAPLVMSPQIASGVQALNLGQGTQAHRLPRPPVQVPLPLPAFIGR
jgi:hypothetical protein